MLQLVGVLIIVNTLISSLWFWSQGRLVGFTPTALIGFALVAGLALIFNERAVEITFAKVASIKASAQQASSDADQIEAIRKRVESQSATIDLVVEQTTQAKTLLADLQKANDQADEKLKLLDQRTSSIIPLPDGTVRMGNMISGNPIALQTAVNDTIAKYKEKQLPEAYSLAQKAVNMLEESQKASKGIAISTGGVSQEGKELVYNLAADLATKQRDFAPALEYSRKAVEAKRDPKSIFMLYICLMNSGNQTEASSLLSDSLKRPDAQELQTLMNSLSMTPK